MDGSSINLQSRLAWFQTSTTPEASGLGLLGKISVNVKGHARLLAPRHDRRQTPDSGHHTCRTDDTRASSRPGVDSSCVSSVVRLKTDRRRPPDNPPTASGNSGQRLGGSDEGACTCPGSEQLEPSLVGRADRATWLLHRTNRNQRDVSGTADK